MCHHSRRPHSRLPTEDKPFLSLTRDNFSYSCPIHLGRTRFHLPSGLHQGAMAIFPAPTSWQNANGLRAAAVHLSRRYLSFDGASEIIQAGSGAHSSHPSFFHLFLLVFEAVLEVICVSLPGYIAARQGMFDADAQK